MTKSFFKKNMSRLRNIDIKLYEELIKKRDIRFKLEIEDSLISVKNNFGEDVYPEDARIYSEKQAKSYLKSHDQNFSYFESILSDTDYKFETWMNDLEEFYPDNYKQRAFSIKSCINKDTKSAIFVGLGAGFHINPILEKTNLSTLIIIEPEIDFFDITFSLHDWKSIFDLVDSNDLSIHFIFNKDESSVFYAISRYFEVEGLYRTVSCLIYKHLDGPFHDKIENFLKLNYSTINISLGFYDDERVGFSHSFSNLKSDVNIAVRSLNRKKNDGKVAIVIGNGPSLNELIPALLKWRDSCILISCGTTLATLMKYDLKPDFHVEQERPYLIYDVLAKGTSKTFRSGIRFVGLNTVHPSVFGLFDKNKRFLIVKPNDLGADMIIKSAIKSGYNSLVLADLANPTVTNFGLSLCVTLGFDHVMLAGVDLGMRDKTKHHASGAVYEEFEGYDETLEAVAPLVVEGNFGGKVHTTQVLNLSRRNIELLIDRYKIKVFNVSDGALISGAMSVDQKDIDFSLSYSSKERESIITERLSEAFVNKPITPIDVDYVINVVSDVIDNLREIFLSDIKTIDDFMTVMSDVAALMKQTASRDTHVWNLLKGTVSSIQCLVTSIMIMESSEASRVWPSLSLAISKVLTELTEDFRANQFSLDKRSIV